MNAPRAAAARRPAQVDQVPAHEAVGERPADAEPVSPWSRTAYQAVASEVDRVGRIDVVEQPDGQRVPDVGR